MQATQDPINFEFVSSYRRIPPTAVFCPMTITGNGTGNITMTKKSWKIRLIWVLILSLAKTPVGLCSLCLGSLTPSYRAPKLVCLLRCGHQMHSGCIERLYQMEQRCPTCQADTIKWWPEDYFNVRKILTRHQDAAIERQTSLKKEYWSLYWFEFSNFSDFIRNVSTHALYSSTNVLPIIFNDSLTCAVHAQ